MLMHAIRSIEIYAPFAEVFNFIADPPNLPRWAHAFEAASAKSARLRTPDGVAEIALRVEASLAQGTVDWIMTFSDGSIGTAMSRVTPLRAGGVVYSFVLNAPPLPLEVLEGALAQQTRTLETELSRLKDILETGHGRG